MKETCEEAPETRLQARTQRRDHTDLLRSRLCLLEGKEKVMMTMYVENGNSFRQIARLLGVSEASISRRIHALMKRLVDGEYITCLRARGKLNPDQIRIARDYFLLGLSVSNVAAKRCTSCYRVRQTIKKIQRLAGTTNGSANSK